MQLSNHLARALLLWALLLGLMAGMMGPRLFSVKAAPVAQTVTHVVISQVYGAGGNANAPYLNDYVELFNPSSNPLPINGWSIQYATATGTGLFSANVTNLSGSLAPGQYYLVQLASGTNGAPLPTPDATGTMNLNANDGKVILASRTTGLACNGSSTPCNVSDLASIIDLVGYGIANYYEGNSSAPPINATKADFRNNNGCDDTDNNSADFTAGAPTPRNSTFSPIITCTDLSLTATAAANLTGTAVSNLTGTAVANITATASAANFTATASAANLTATASAANLTGTSAALTGTPTATATATTTCPTSSTTTGLAIIINEVAWAGTAASPNDEWIELYNPPGGAVGCIRLDGWQLFTTDGSPTINLTGTIQDGGYFLLERGDENTVSNIKADQIYTDTIGLLNTGESLYLENNNFLIDSANGDGGSWPAGTAASTSSLTSYRSMERRGVVVDSTAAWVTYTYTGTGEFRAGRDRTTTGIINGTPKHSNWILTVTPTKTSTPPPKPTRIKTATPKPVGRPIINEYLPRPGFDWNQDGQINVFDEFIEVMNIGPVDISVAGWRLEVVSGASFTLPSVTLKPGQRMIFYGLQTNILLSDGGGTVRLLNVNGQVWDAHTYSIAKEPDKSWCRLPDGTFSWFGDCVPTPGTTNTRAGEVPVAPDEDELQPKTCNFPDTMPLDFKIAECFGYGSNMWRSMFWDLKGWGDQFVPENTSKWNSFVE